MTIPNFEDGVLPVGDYEVTFEELRQSILVKGSEKGSENWDTEWRLHLIDNLEKMVSQLWEVGITEIFVDGSFTEEKDHPNDIDGYFECDLKKLASGELQTELNLLDPYKVWTWDHTSRKPYRGYSKPQLPMWHKYRVELFPQPIGMNPPSGIKDEHGHDIPFSSAFRKSRTDHKPKGIVKILKDKGGQNDT